MTMVEKIVEIIGGAVVVKVTENILGTGVSFLANKTNCNKILTTNQKFVKDLFEAFEIEPIINSMKKNSVFLIKSDYWKEISKEKKRKKIFKESGTKLASKALDKYHGNHEALFSKFFAETNSDYELEITTTEPSEIIKILVEYIGFNGLILILLKDEGNYVDYNSINSDIEIHL